MTVQRAVIDLVCSSCSEVGAGTARFFVRRDVRSVSPRRRLPPGTAAGSRPVAHSPSRSGFEQTFRVAISPTGRARLHPDLRLIPCLVTLLRLSRILLRKLF